MACEKVHRMKTGKEGFSPCGCEAESDLTSLAWLVVVTIGGTPASDGGWDPTSLAWWVYRGTRGLGRPIPYGFGTGREVAVGRVLGQLRPREFGAGGRGNTLSLWGEGQLGS